MTQSTFEAELTLQERLQLEQTARRQIRNLDLKRPEDVITTLSMWTRTQGLFHLTTLLRAERAAAVQWAAELLQ